MKRLLAKNIGPIRNENNAWVEMRKVTILCGPQGAGKSTLAKLFSEFCWLEKAMTRGDFLSDELTAHDRFRKKYCSFHNIQNYFRSDTYIRYEGDKYVFTYENSKLDVVLANGHDYVRPQVMYIPAERNLLNVVDNADSIKGLPSALDVLLTEYINALRSLSGTESLPIPGYAVHYDKLNKIAWLDGTDFKVRISESASGFQSLIPTVLVSRYLGQQVAARGDDPQNKSTESYSERERRDKAIRSLLNDTAIDDATRLTLIKQLSTNTRNGRLINVVEEVEQNLFPASQKHVLYELLKINNELPLNRLMLTTHSPYILNYISLAVKAGNLSASISDEKGKSALCEIIPQQSQLRTEDVGIYEISADGEISRLGTVYGIPQDNNFLNNALEDSNETFDLLMDIEEEYAAD